jgi:hypothetical protein
VDHWLTDQRSHSDVAALAEPERDKPVHDLALIRRSRCPSGSMEVEYDTWLWIAERNEATT